LVSILFSSVFTANIHGVLLYRSPGSTDEVSPLIHTPTAIQSLRTLALHLSLRIPALLTSPPSSGKSLLLHHIASTIHPGVRNQIINIHLADTSLDPRSLLGAYVSSPTHPGTFEWKEGILVRAMREGKWVVFKDIHKGSSEILGIIKPLTESLRVGKWIGGCASLEVPNRGRVDAHPNFALFATRSLTPSATGCYPPPSFLGATKFYEVTITSPTHDELQTIIDSHFPLLAGNPSRGLIRLWEAVRAHGSSGSPDVGLGELEKFCSRIANILHGYHQSMDVHSEIEEYSLPVIFPNPIVREDMYLEARDVFFGVGPLTTSARARLDAITITVADHLGLEPERSNWVLHKRPSKFHIEKDANGRVTAVSVGRARISARLTDLELTPPVPRPFVMHKPAELLLSRIVTALYLGEPLLLTGETATGKTSTVSHLASLLGRPLISLNLSHQTESSDLIGGFKPIDARIPAAALQERFLELFGNTFSRRKNSAFEESLRKALHDGKWKRAVETWKEAARLAKERLQTKQLEMTR
jgi:midasin